MTHDHLSQHGAAGEMPPPGAGHAGHAPAMEADFRRRCLVCAALTVPVLLLSPMIQAWLGFALVFPGQPYLLWGLASVIALWGAWPFYAGAARALPHGTLDMNVLVSVAVAAGYLFSTAATFLFPAPEFYGEISTLVVFLLFGHWMEMRSLRGATGALQELARLIPPTAQRIVDEHTETVPTAQLQKGDVLLVRPGEQVPIDGAVLDGASEVNEALITGEARPVPKGPGDAVIGGAVNGTGAFRMRVTATGRETAVAQIVALIAQAQASKTRTQRLADQAAQYLTLAALLVGVGAFIVWAFLLPQGVVFALLRMVSVLIVACPHALGLAIPTVVIIAAALAARAGILIRHNEAAESAARLQTIVFDKTGTLTQGVFGVTRVLPAGRFSAEEVLRRAAALEAHSEHAVAQGIVRAARERDLPLPPVRDFQAIPGQGARGIVEDAVVTAGNRALMDALGIDLPEAAPRGDTLVHVAVDATFAGTIALADVIRPESYPAVRDLQARGLEVVMLTGDRRAVAEAVARELGVQTVLAEVQPGQKAARIAELQAAGTRVGMVGDGINDAPALAQADVGIAIGAGTQVAIESADIVLVRDDPRDVARLLILSRAVRRKMRQNLLWATGYNVVAIPVAAGVLARYGILLRPEWAALLMAASTIIVVLNALLLRRTQLPAGDAAPPHGG